MVKKKLFGAENVYVVARFNFSVNKYTLNEIL